MEKQTVPLSELSPSAARLLLALATARENEQMDMIMQRAGIRSLGTYWKAKQQLLDGRYLYIANGGELKATLSPR